MKRLPITFLIFGLWGSAIHAQMEDHDLVVRHFKIAAINQPVRQVYFDNNGVKEELVAYPGRFGKGFTYRGAPVMSLYKLGKGPGGEEVKVPVGQFEFRGNEGDWLLFIAKGKSVDRYSIIGYTNTASLASRGGQFDFINLSSKPVIGIFGDQKMAVNSGGRSTLTKKQIKLAEGRDSTQIQFAFRTKDDWKRFYTNIWPIDDNRASIIIFYNKPGSGEVELNWISEMLTSQ